MGGSATVGRITDPIASGEVSATFAPGASTGNALEIPPFRPRSFINKTGALSRFDRVRLALAPMLQVTVGGVVTFNNPLLGMEVRLSEDPGPLVLGTLYVGLDQVFPAVPPVLIDAWVSLPFFAWPEVACTLYIDAHNGAAVPRIVTWRYAVFGEFTTNRPDGGA